LSRDQKAINTGSVVDFASAVHNGVGASREAIHGGGILGPGDQIGEVNGEE
jgi:hypothetical protein